MLTGNPFKYKMDYSIPVFIVLDNLSECIRWHFIGVYSVCLVKNNLQGQKYIIFYQQPLKNKMDDSLFIVKRVKYCIYTSVQERASICHFRILVDPRENCHWFPAC